jgi:hypothetical protein
VTLSVVRSEPIVFRGGLIPRDASTPRVSLTPYLLAGAGVLPPAVDYYTGIAYLGMLGNDQWGDCVFAGDGHIVEQQTALGDKSELKISTQDALAAYSAVTGFDPNAGPPGENPTDNGAQVSDGLNYLRTHGMADWKIAAYGDVDVSNHTALKRAIWEFGALSIGFSVPESAMEQFNAGQPWTVVPDSPIEGGHCVIACGYDASYVYVITWGAIQKMTWDFWNTYVSEAHAIIAKDWDSVSGLSLTAFGQEWVATFGGQNPFAPTPPPSPTPPVTPPNGCLPSWLGRLLSR